MTAESARAGLFRREALAHSNGGPSHEGDVLRLSPAWSRAAYGVLVLAFAASLLVMLFTTVNEYASGPAVVWVKGRLDLTATRATSVVSVDVRPGVRVARGSVLARFYSVQEEAELARVTHELDLQIARTLRDPADQEGRAAVTSLVTAKDLARAHLDELTLRAPRDGVVGDVRIREGQRLAAGDIVVTLLDDGAERTLVAMLPSHAHPQLRPGQQIRFEVDGYRYAYQELTIARVGAQIVGPAEVRRYLGQEISDTLPLAGSYVLVEANLGGGQFRVDGATLDLHHGMLGVAEARVREERLFVALFPAVRAVEKLFR
jgi:multidrug efflux pump subunit AcrA (membrane-fusion protein)